MLLRILCAFSPRVFLEVRFLSPEFKEIPYEKLETRFGKYLGFTLYVGQKWLLKKKGKLLVFGIVAVAGFNTLTGVFGDSFLVWLAKRIFGF